MLITLCLGYFMVILDTMIVTVALPAMQSDLHTGLSDLQWVVDGYTLAFAALLLLGGSLSDRLGARRVLECGLICFGLASAACGAASSPAILIGARALQGAGAALLVPSSLSLLRSSYPDRGSRARAIGAWGAIAGIAAASGPVLGGLLVDSLGWRSIFLLNLPIGLGALVMTRRYLPSPAGRRGRGFDPLAQALAIAALGTLVLALIESGRAGWADPAVIGSFAASAVAAAAFVAVESRAANPMLPLEIFNEAGVATGSAVGLLINFGFYGQLFVINLYFQQLLGLSALETGLALLPEAAAVALASGLSGRITKRRGSPRAAMLLGLSIGGAGLLGLSLTGPRTAYPALIAPMIATGGGMALTMPAATTAVVDAAPAALAGLASGVLNAARQAGGAVGVALLGTMIAAGHGFHAGLRAGLVTAAAAFFAAAVLAALTIRSSPEVGGHAPAAGDPGRAVGDRHRG